MKQLRVTYIHVVLSFSIFQAFSFFFFLGGGGGGRGRGRGRGRRGVMFLSVGYLRSVKPLL